MTHEERLVNGGWAVCRFMGREMTCWVRPRDLWELCGMDDLEDGFVCAQVADDGPHRRLEFVRWIT